VLQEARRLCRYDPSLDPILRLALTGTGDLGLTREVAEERLKQEFESVKGVAAAQVKGGLEDEIQINLDQERLAARGIPLDRVREVVGFSNVNLPGGALEDRNNRYIIT
jgi:HAE1 family hydrophobic/amphiphilic exporter-1